MVSSNYTLDWITFSSPKSTRKDAVSNKWSIKTKGGSGEPISRCNTPSIIWSWRPWTLVGHRRKRSLERKKDSHGEENLTVVWGLHLPDMEVWLVYHGRCQIVDAERPRWGLHRGEGRKVWHTWVKQRGGCANPRQPTWYLALITMIQGLFTNFPNGCLTR
jgi:hypothetical protein